LIGHGLFFSVEYHVVPTACSSKYLKNFDMCSRFNGSGVRCGSLSLCNRGTPLRELLRPRLSRPHKYFTRVEDGPVYLPAHGIADSTPGYSLFHSLVCLALLFFPLHRPGSRGSVQTHAAEPTCLDNLAILLWILQLCRMAHCL
jgi:hypothetical protein